MSPSGGITTLDENDITWSALNTTPSRAKHRWSGAWPGVASAVQPATASPSATAGPNRPDARKDRRPGRRHQRRQRADMVDMAVARKNPHHPAAARRQDRGHVRGVVRPRVKHAHPVLAVDEVGVGAVIGHRPRVVATIRRIPGATCTATPAAASVRSGSAGSLVAALRQRHHRHRPALRPRPLAPPAPVLAQEIGQARRGRPPRRRPACSTTAPGRTRRSPAHRPDHSGIS